MEIRMVIALCLLKRIIIPEQKNLSVFFNALFVFARVIVAFSQHKYKSMNSIAYALHFI